MRNSYVNYKKNPPPASVNRTRGGVIVGGFVKGSLCPPSPITIKSSKNTRKINFLF